MSQQREIHTAIVCGSGAEEAEVSPPDPMILLYCPQGGVGIQTRSQPPPEDKHGHRCHIPVRRIFLLSAPVPPVSWQHASWHAPVDR
jgi:hypothetical protein